MTEEKRKGKAFSNCFHKLGVVMEENDRLKQENENAKTTVEECHKYMAKLEDENEKLKKGYEKRGEIMKTAALQRENYRSALEEIREIAEGYIKEEGCRIPLGAIKMIIDEVLGYVKHRRD